MISKIQRLFLPITLILDFIQKYFKSLVFIFIIIFISSSSEDSIVDKSNLIEIDIHGPIFSADEFLEKIDYAKNENIKGILIDINSPGGAVAPSVEIANAIKSIRKIKPVVVYASGTMTSGGYYSAIWSDKIIANPGSMVGSIGVLFQSANIKQLLKNIGIESQSVTKGKYKEVGTPTREWSNIEKLEIQKVIDDTYEMFVEDVAKARGLVRKDHTIFADAHLFTARQAKDVGLVDVVDTKYRAIIELKLLSGVNKEVWHKNDESNDFLERFLYETSSKVVNEFILNIK
jgi:protease-4